MRLAAIEQFQMQVATRLLGEALEELARQTEPERARHVLPPLALGDALERQMVQAAPDQNRPAAEIHDASRQTFIHRNKRLAGPGIEWMKAGSIAPDSLLVSQRLAHRLPERDAAILDGVMPVHFEVALAAQVEIHHRVLRKQRQHVVKKRNTRLDTSFASPVEIQFQADAGFFSDALDGGLP